MQETQSKKIRTRQRKGRDSAIARSIERAGDQIAKRMTLGGPVLATGAGTVIVVQAVTSAQVQSIPAAEWASFASRYQQYRVRAIRVRGKAVNPVQSATVVHSVLYRGDYIGSASPGSAAQVLSDENSEEIVTCKDFTDIVTWARNPNARLWNPTSAAIPGANTFAWVCASPSTPALTTATTYYALVYEWEVEFRGSQ
jgi:hypothetical protein